MLFYCRLNRHHHQLIIIQRDGNITGNRKEAKNPIRKNAYLIIIEIDIKGVRHRGELKCIRRNRSDFVVSQGHRDGLCRREIENSGGSYEVVV